MMELWIDFEVEYKGIKNEDMEDFVVSKRRKFGVDVFKKSVNFLLVDIDNIFLKVMFKFGDFRKEKVVMDESRDLEKFVLGVVFLCEFLRLMKLENDLEIFIVVVIVSVGVCLIEFLYGSSVYFGVGYEVGYVFRNCEEIVGFVVVVLVVEEMGVLGNLGLVGEVVV